MEDGECYDCSQKECKKRYIQLSTNIIATPIRKDVEKIVHDSLYPHLFDNKLISDKQSGYRRNDSTIRQLLSITHEIYKAFDSGHEVRAVFLDISRAFDRVWHEGLIFKLRQNGVEGNALNALLA